MQDIEEIIKNTAFGMSSAQKHKEGEARNASFEAESAAKAAEALSSRELLNASTSGYCAWYHWPHKCPTLVAACSVKKAAEIAKTKVCSALEDGWQQRHLALKAAPAVQSRPKPPPTCVFPNGCVCKGIPQHIHKSVSKSLKGCDKELLKQGRVVFRLQPVMLDSDGFSVLQSDPQWWHVSFLSLKPWRASFAKLYEVDAVANPMAEGGFVRPFLDDDGFPYIVPLPRCVYELDPQWSFKMTIFRTSSARAPLAVLKGQARVFKASGEVVVWKLGDERRQVVRKTKEAMRDAQDTTSRVRSGDTSWGVLAEEKEASSDDVASEGELSEVDQLDPLMTVAAAPSREELGHKRSASSSSSDVVGKGKCRVDPEGKC